MILILGELHLPYHRRRRRAWGSVATDLKCLVTPTLDNNTFLYGRVLVSSGRACKSF